MEGVETRTVTYLAPGAVPDLTPAEPPLDPKLAEIRDAEIKANDVTIDPAPEPTIDPALVRARDEQIKRENERAGISPEPVKAPAKKAAPSKTSK
jgi:hypothetical protein